MCDFGSRRLPKSIAQPSLQIGLSLIFSRRCLRARFVRHFAACVWNSTCKSEVHSFHRFWFSPPFAMSPAFFARRFLSIALAAALSDVGSARAAEKVGGNETLRSHWQIAESENFSVCCPQNVDPHEIAKECEHWRARLISYWLGPSAVEEIWPTRCYVVLHPSATSYVQSVGAARADLWLLFNEE